MKTVGITSGIVLVLSVFASRASERTIQWDGGSATIEGVCTIDPEISCWSADGQKIKPLALFESPDFGLGRAFMRKLDFKHRFVILKMNGNSAPEFPDAFHHYSSQSQGPPTVRIFVSVYSRVEQTEVTLNGQLAVGKLAQAPLKLNAVLRAPGHEYVIQGIKARPVGGYSLPIKTTTGKTWTVTCRVKAFDAKKTPPQPLVIDADGVTVRGVSPIGLPVLIDPANSGFSGYGGQPALPEGVSLAKFLPSIPADLEHPKTIEYTTNIDPSKVKYLRYVDVEYKPLKISGIPLEPSRS